MIERQYTGHLFTRSLTEHYETMETPFKIRYSPLQTCRQLFSAVDLLISGACQNVRQQGASFYSIDLNYCRLDYLVVRLTASTIAIDARTGISTLTKHIPYDIVKPNHGPCMLLQKLVVIRLS